MRISLAIFLSLASVNLLIGSVDGKEIYNKKCASCHGKNADKKAMGTSKKINLLTPELITDALNSYQDGSYRGKYKGMKKSMARKLNQEDINAVTSYIQTLK